MKNAFSWRDGHHVIVEYVMATLFKCTTHIAAIAVCRHRDQAELQESEARLKEAQRIAKIGYWERD